MILLLLLASPADAARIKVIGELTHEATLAPGQLAEGRFEIRNNGDTPQEVRIYQQDYRFQADGSNDFLEPGTLDRSNAGWVAWTPHQLVLQPGETAPVAWEMRLPADAEQDGTFWSTLMVEPVLPAPEENQGAVVVNTLFRYAIQMVTQVGEAEAALAFAAPHLLDQDGAARLRVDLENTGGRSLVPNVWVDVFREDGERMGRFDAGALRLYPGTSGRFVFDLQGLPPGRYSALVVADNGDAAVFGAQYTLELGGTRTASATP